MSLRSYLAPMLKKGYRIDPDGHVRDRDGKLVRLADGEVIKLGTTDSDSQRRRALQHLREAGAVPTPRRRKAKMQHKVKPPAQVSEKNPHILAREILRDPRASGRERAMARAFIEADTRILAVQELAQKLGQRLREYQPD